MMQLELQNTVNERVLVLFARSRLEDCDLGELRDLVGEVTEWDELLEMLQWHKLEGLVYRHIVDNSLQDLVPTAIQAELKGLYMRNVARQMHFKIELKRLLLALGEHDIPVAVMKGAALDELVYVDPGVRPMSDLDLLVPLNRSEQAWEIVKSLGYHVTVDEAEQQRMQAIDRQLALLVHDTKSIIVEIHTHLVEADSPMRFDIEVFWSSTVACELAGTPTMTFVPEYQLANQCLNFFKDRDIFSYSALGQLCDVAEVVRTYQDDLDWDAFGPDSALSKLTGPIFCGLYLARYLLGAPVPDRAIERVSPVGFDPDDAGRLVHSRVFGEQFAMKQIVSPTDNYGKLRLLKGVISRVFEGREAIATRYGVPAGSKRVYLLYIRRFFEALRIGASMAGDPRGVRDDLSTDRWLHSLQHPEESKSTSKRSDTEEVGI